MMKTMATKAISMGLVVVVEERKCADEEDNEDYLANDVK